MSLRNAEIGVRPWSLTAQYNGNIAKGERKSQNCELQDLILVTDSCVTLEQSLDLFELLFPHL